MTIEHASFELERTYQAATAAVFAAWAQQAAKAQWFGGESEPDEHSLDFRVGGRELLRGTEGDMAYVYDAVYRDIVTDERIVWSYDMHINGSRISVSLATVELTGVPGGTRLVLTEQGAFLDGLDTNDQRRAGTEELLDKLGDLVSK